MPHRGQSCFQDDINSLKEFEGGDGFVCEFDGDVRKVFRLYADDFSTIHLNVIPAKYWSTSWPSCLERRRRMNGTSLSARRLTRCTNACARQKRARGAEKFLERIEQV